MDANDTGHIWLRQTVTFTVDGQTRTLEIGIPVPPDATAQDIEALLEVADIGMSALSRRLDTQIAEALGETSARTVESPAAAHQSLSANGRAPTKPVEMERAPEVALPVERTRSDHPATPPAPTVPAQQTRPATQAPASERPTPTPTQRKPDQSRLQPAPTSGAEMTRPEFLAAVATLGLNPRQAMDRLGVRSLEGLNLREALESLRRQLLGVSSQAEPEPASDIFSAPDADEMPGDAPSAVARFEEEEDEAILYAMDEDDELIEEDMPAPSDAGATQQGASDEDLDDLDFDDVPDLSPPPTPSRSRVTSATRKAPSATHKTAAPDTETTSTSRVRSQAVQLIGKLRMATGGGAANDYQRNAYRNIVENELGRARAVALVRGLWRTTADRLTSGQLDALIRWGKEEVFAEEAEQVLAALQAEQKRAEQQSADAPETDAPATPRSAPRGRSSGGTR